MLRRHTVVGRLRRASPQGHANRREWSNSRIAGTCSMDRRKTDYCSTKGTSIVARAAFASSGSPSSHVKHTNSQRVVQRLLGLPYPDGGIQVLTNLDGLYHDSSEDKTAIRSEKAALCALFGKTLLARAISGKCCIEFAGLSTRYHRIHEGGAIRHVPAHLARISST